MGQRKGLGIALGRPVFVRAIDPASGDVLLCDAGEEYAAEIRLREVCAPDQMCIRDSRSPAGAGR